jgi:hypothetical protein
MILQGLVLLLVLVSPLVGATKKFDRFHRPVWNLSGSPSDENLTSALSSCLSPVKPDKDALVVDDFRLSWSVVVGSFWEGSGGGMIRFQEGKTFGNHVVKELHGDVVIHQGMHPGDHSTQWRLQALFFPDEGAFAGLMHSGFGVIENVKMQLPLSNLSFASVVSQLTSLGPNLTSSSWLPYDEMVKMGMGVFDGGNEQTRNQMCYFVVTGRVTGTEEFSEPPWRRNPKPGRGLGNPIVKIEIGMMSPNCGLVLKAEGKSVFLKGIRQGKKKKKRNGETVCFQTQM